MEEQWQALHRREPGKRWAAALFAATCAAERPAARIAVVSRTEQDARDTAKLIQKAARTLGLDEPKLYQAQRKLAWPNGSRARFFLAERPIELWGERHDVAWLDSIGRSKDTMAAIESACYGLHRLMPDLGIVIETAESMSAETFPQLRDCLPELLEAGHSLLELNGGWGTAWTIRDSDADVRELTIRWGSTSSNEVRAIVAMPVGAKEPSYSLSWPGASRRETFEWSGKPHRCEEFAEHLRRYQWEQVGYGNRAALLAGLTVHECVAAAERLVGRQI